MSRYPRLADDAFDETGFDRRLVNALLAFGCNDPTEVLALSRWQLTVIPMVGPKGRAQIEAYRERVSKAGPVPPP